MLAMKGEDGFTLIEVLVALVILVIIVLGMTTFFLNSYRNVILAGKKAVTVYEAQQELEKAIDDPDRSEEGRIERVPGYELEIFGKIISGTKITVEEAYDEKHGREVTYVTFIPD